MEYRDKLNFNIKEIETICEDNRLSLILAIQIDKEELELSSCVFGEETDLRFHEALYTLENGNVGFTTVSTKTKNQYDKMNNVYLKFLKKHLKKLEDSDRSGKTEFHKDRAEIENLIKDFS